MPSEDVIHYPLIYDITGTRHFRPGTTCIRQRAAPADGEGRDLNNCLAWKVELSDNYQQLRLVSRPAGLVVPLTESHGACLLIYAEAPELKPEQYPAMWHELLAAGWGVWGSIDGQQLFLNARHPAYPEDIVISRARQYGAHIDCITSDAMWAELRILMLTEIQ